MDIEVLRELLEDEESVCDFLNIDHAEKNGRTYIICPFHDDHSFGSAFMNRGQFHCFACGAHGDMFTLIQKVLNCGFAEAIQSAAKYFGYSVDSKTESPMEKAYRKFKLSPEEMDVLDFPKNAISLKQIFFASSTIYRQIVVDKANAQLSHYKNIRDKVTERGTEEAFAVYEMYDDTISSSVYTQLKAEAISRIRIIEEILKRFD